MAYFARLVRGTMLETLQQDYVRTARAKGLRWRRRRRAARAPQLAHPGGHRRRRRCSASSSPARSSIEMIFAIPGIGRYYVTAVTGTRLLGRDGDHRAALASSSSSRTSSSTSSTGSSTRGRGTRGPDGHRSREPTFEAASSPGRVRGDASRTAEARGAEAGPRSGVRRSGRTPTTASSRNRAPSSPRSPSSSCSLYVIFVPIVSPVRPVRRRLLAGVPAAEPGAPVRHRPVRPRPLRRARRSGGRVSIAIGFARDVRDHGRSAIVYGAISGFVGGQLDNALMRFLDALYGLPYLPFAIITLAIFGDGQLLDDGRRADDRVAGSRPRGSCAARSSR